MRSVSVRLCDLGKVTIPLGFVGENNFTRVYIDCKKIFDEHPDALPALSVIPPYGDAYPAVVTKEGDMVIWEVTASDLIYTGNGEMQLSFVDGETIGKTLSARTRVYKSIEPSGEVPDPVANWLVEANAALAAIDAMGREF